MTTVNADQISALVTMQGFHSGKAVNTLAPFGAAYHFIVYAAEQMVVFITVKWYKEKNKS